MNRRSFLATTAACATTALAGCSSELGTHDDAAVADETFAVYTIPVEGTDEVSDIVVFPDDGVVCYHYGEAEDTISGRTQAGCVDDPELAAKYERLYKEHYA